MTALPSNVGDSARNMSATQIVGPSLRRGWTIFASRPLSLVVVLIAAVAISVVSFLLLTFPVIAAYYYAVRQSRREEYFIDLNAVAGTVLHFFVGIGKHFWKSYWLGVVGLLVPGGLLVLPAVVLEVAGQRSLPFSLILMVLWLPAFFLTGAAVLYGYPYLVSAQKGSALGYALSRGKARPFSVVALGFLLLFPIPGFIFHLLMVFSYPILVSSSLGIAEDMGIQERGIAGAQEVTLGRLGIALALAAVMFGLIFLLAWVWSGVGFFVGIALSFLLAFLARSKGLL